METVSGMNLNKDKDSYLTDKPAIVNGDLLLTIHY